MILNMTGGGVGGCVLTVTAPVGAVVTASKDGRTLTKTAASGTAVFRGLEGGEWSVACTDGAQTSVPQTVTVKNDYAAELTFFAATIQVTYPAGSTCTAADGVTTLTAPDTSGSWKCTVPNAGTWTVSCTDGSETDSDSVSIASDGQSASVTLTYRTMIYDLGWGDTASGFQSHYTGPTSSDRWPITVTYENGYIVMNRTTYNGGACVYTNVGFDLTDVDTVCCKTGNIGSGSGADSPLEKWWSGCPDHH